MRVFVRNKATGCYFRKASQWVMARSDAFDFAEIQRASALICAESWTGMEVVVAYDQPACDLILPQTPLWVKNDAD